MAAIDNYAGLPQKDGPYTSAAAVTPSDTVDLTNVTRGLMNTGTSGVATVIMQDGQTATLWFTAGVIVPVRVTRVKATGLVGGGVLVALW